MCLTYALTMSGVHRVSLGAELLIWLQAAVDVSWIALLTGVWLALLHLLNVQRSGAYFLTQFHWGELRYG